MGKLTHEKHASKEKRHWGWIESCGASREYGKRAAARVPRTVSMMKLLSVVSKQKTGQAKALHADGNIIAAVEEISAPS